MTQLKNRKETDAMLKTPREAVIYARVSTKEQEEFGHSIPAQLKSLREYAERRGFKVIKEFAFSESAGLKIRKKFDEVIAFLHEHKKDGEMPVFLCQNVDRVTRNHRDTADIDDMRRQEGLEVHFVQENFILNARSTGNELFIWEMKALIAKQYINRLMDDSMRSLRYKLQNGEAISYAPLGYLNVTDERGRATVKLDESRFMLVRKVFTEYAKGTFTIGEISKKASEWGLRTRKGHKLATSQLYSMLVNRFYCGYQAYKEEWHPHIHPKIIDEDTFNRCQQVRLGWNKKPFQYSARSFTFRGLITCGHCGCSYTSEIKKGKYIYLSCTRKRDPDCPAPRMKEEQVFDQLVSVFDRMAFPEAIMPDIRNHLTKANEAKMEFRDTALKNLKSDLASITRQLDNLVNALISERITPDVHDEKARVLQQRQHEIRQQLAAFDHADEDFATSVKLLLALVNNAGRLFRSSNVEQKRKLVALVCQNLVLTGGTLEYTLKKPFELFLEKDKSRKWLRELDSNQRPSD